ncbi:Uncharacterized protein OS=Sphingobacterium paucimobilis HER1398 GN=M472_09200 PE=4 SV=1: Abhydrolase_5 [Tuwongella immobilis]|uniref:Alpha/beta hydrolase n=2 Tax=Tuwongella immobilis TaxID=692036 RepID=A0A6C2YLT8_9BACT|nr:Uncharacterized protein OS=Sphingobacterium paucimobilis HER1398 GN=M472_09200 PE=4 SV=1: Abhydrolase_5 [Tuwongella immobilis]VTS01067.1 Uncharacterized protein OS=Sphingobacterium paucimobilis HER1398 GN=M472_09200 PE=4 SV=1: Abhydrolase_5 [Tuwongella immobilis]
MDRRTAILTATATLLAGAKVRAQGDPKRAGTVKSNVEYASVGGKSLRLDVHLPTGKGPFPAIVLVHGGGFTGGAKGGYTGELARHLARNGFVAFDIDYRLMRDLGPGASLPKAIAAAQEDLARAFDFVISESKTFGIDPDRVAVGGGSAGAITSLLATYGPDRMKRRPKAVVGLWGGMYGQESAIQRGDPPMLLVHGTADKTVAFALSEAIVAAARKVGVEAVLMRVENGGHTLPLNQRYQGRTIAESVTDFLKQQLK